jgi:hypothetical protein
LQSASPWEDLASAATTDLGAQTTDNLRITGTTTITSFGTTANGVTRNLRFAAALTLTHNATSLILPGGANIITEAGDTGTAKSLGSGNWVLTDWQRASALPVLPGLITTSGLTLATARVLGRLAAGTGAIEEIPIANPVAAVSIGINRATEQATTSGVSIDFTGIPNGVRRVTIMFDRLSTNGASDLVFRLGKSGDPAGTFIATGYNGSYTGSGGTSIETFSGTTGFGISNNNAVRSFSGSIVLNALTNSLWTAAGVYGGNGNGSTSGSIDLSGTLDRLRLTTLGGTNTFDAGTINISWEF